MKKNLPFLILFLLIVITGISGYAYQKSTDRFTAIHEISKSDLNSTLEITGEVVKKEKSDKGHIFLRIKDDTGEINVPLFKANNINSKKVKVGKEIEIRGQVDEYNGEIELIPSSNQDVKVK